MLFRSPEQPSYEPPPEPPYEPPYEPEVGSFSIPEPEPEPEVRSCTANLEQAVKQVSQDLNGITYSSVPRELRDCSGIFHQAVQKFKTEHCPNGDYPNPTEQRSTRLIGKWYHDRGRLTLIRNPLKQSHLIKPGAIIFYGAPGKKFSGVTSDLFIRGKGIYHMGIVVSVDHKNGQVFNYHIFHGRKRGKSSGVTSYHRRKPRRSTYPPYGNGTEQWIAVAFLAE